MGDIDDEDQAQPYLDAGVIQRIEVDMLTAISGDYEGTFGETATVTAYLAVAEIIKPNGELDMFWTAPDGMSPQAMLGLARWLWKRVDEMT